jgi:hypothetical protein
MKVYISGAISNLPREGVKAKFDNAALSIVSAGHTPVSPLDNGIDPDAPWEDHMSVDLPTLLKCDAVLFLNDWQTSRGARVELAVASEARKKLFVMVGEHRFAPVTNVKYKHLID